MEPRNPTQSLIILSFQSYLIHIYLQGNFISTFLNFHGRRHFEYYYVIIQSFFDNVFVFQIVGGESEITAPVMLGEKHSLKLSTFV